MTSDQLAFVDCETTGLDPDVHQIWEVALIIDQSEFLWHLPVDLGHADAFALKIGNFHERYANEPGLGRIRRSTDKFSVLTPLSEFAESFAAMTRGRHLVGAVVSFDEERLRKLLRANGACNEWHYHIIDVEALCIGYINGLREGLEIAGLDNVDSPIVAASDTAIDIANTLPWKSEDLSRAVGVDPTLPEYAKHTAMGDARWAKALYEKVTG